MIVVLNIERIRIYVFHCLPTLLKSYIAENFETLTEHRIHCTNKSLLNKLIICDFYWGSQGWTYV